MATLLEYECPSCGGALQFDSALQKVKCPYCESEFEMEALKGRDAVLEEAQPPGEENLWAGEESISSYICRSCGGEILCDASTAATSCPYCDSPVVMKERLGGMLRPDLVIPFKLDKEAAKAALVKHISGKVLLPKCFKSENRINEIKGIYVPFWLFDADASGDARYRATRVRTWSDANYNYTQTKYYEVRRAGTMAFRAVPVDGSTKMPDDLMESIEPYDMSQAVDFQTAYLAGYLADKYDVDAETAKPRAQARMETGTRETLRQTVTGYDGVTEQGADVQITHGKARYVLLPVWLLHTRYENKDYTFAMNGQTGRMVGDLPMSRLAYWLWFAGISLAGTALAALVGMLLG